MWTWLTSIFTNSFISSITSGIGSWLNRKQEFRQRIEEAKVSAEIARIEQTTRMLGDADVASVEAQRYSIKDELVLILIFAPYVGAFIPGLQPYVKDGFAIIASLPMWYQVSIIGIIISTMGLRFMLGRFFKGDK